MKKIGISLALLLGFQVATVADTTRVESYHNNKSHHTHKAHHDNPYSVRLKTNQHNFQEQSRHQTHRQKVHPHRVRPHMRRTHHRPFIRHHRPDFVVPSYRRMGHCVSRIDRNAYRFRHGGLNYRYRSGIFYRPYHNGFRVVPAPLGAIVLNLPSGYVSFSYANSHYYRYDNAYYQWAPRRNGYRVVRDPYLDNSYQPYQYRVGDMLASLPQGATAVIIDDVTYYTYGNQYFLPQRRSGVRMYLVVDF